MKGLWTKLFVMLLPAAIVTAVPPGTAYAGPTPTYHAVDLGTLGGSWSMARAINGRDEVVGFSGMAGGENHPFLWRQGRMIDLGVLPGSTGFGVATGINDRGEVVGVSETASGSMHAFLWYGGHMTDLGTLGGGASFALAINNRSQVVGYSYGPADGTPHGFLWQHGVMRDLGEVEPASVNDRGQVVGGWYPSLYERHGFLWQRGQILDLPFLGAVDVNNRGWVAGTSVLPDFSTRAVLWRHGTGTLLGTLGGTQSDPSAINDRGQVLGRSTTPDGEVHGVIWQDGTVVDLATRGIVLQSVPQQAIPGEVVDINNRGHIAASLVSTGDWNYHATLFR